MITLRAVPMLISAVGALIAVAWIASVSPDPPSIFADSRTSQAASSPAAAHAAKLSPG